MEEAGWRPFFATGKVVRDYRPLLAYWKTARERGREDLIDKSMISNEDFEYMKSRVTGLGEVKLGELLEAAIDRVKGRIDPEIASLTFRGMGRGLEGDRAAEELTLILAGWLVESLEHWGYIRIKLPS